MNPKTFLQKSFLVKYIWQKGIGIFNKFNQLGRRHFCPVCGRSFLFFRNKTECRYCSSFERHRKLAYYIQSHAKELINTHQICEFAPGTGDFRSLFSRLGIQFKQYLYADINPARYSRFKVIKFDLECEKLPLDETTIDIIIIVSVLEHIPDDSKALRNLYRILNPGGVVYVHVPMDDTLEHTIEYGKPNPEEYDHVRLYGKDFGKRAVKAGFSVKKVQYSNIAKNKKIISWMQLDTSPFFILKKLTEKPEDCRIS